MPWVVGVGVALIIVFMTPPRELRAAWFQHAMLPLNLVSAFVDVVSYVRLFAVGAASFAVASAFDQMALGTGLSGPLAGLAAALILFLGHTLNILLATMGVLVHGVRLNTLEFAGHLGLEWSGHPYRPFRHETPEVERA
jgi:V/A-type H+-transporting ATPase subunit I